jgi:hypothetical protein
MTLLKIEKQIKEEIPELRLKGYFKKEADELTIDEFIESFLEHMVEDYATINSETKTLITKSNVIRRSLGEIYQITKYYYPKTKLQDVITSLFSRVGKIYGWRYTYCHQKNKKMFYYKPTDKGWIQSVKDEYGNTETFYQQFLIK